MTNPRYQGLFDDEPARIETDDGLKLHIRLIRPNDDEGLLDLFEHLSPETRWRRFHAGVNNLSSKVKRDTAKRLANVDNRALGGAILALHEENGAEAIVGVARLARPLEQPDAPIAEAAITVRDDFQKRGIGTELLRRLVLLAKTMKVKTMLAEVEADNLRAIQLFQNLDLPTDVSASHGEIAMLIKMPGD